MRDLLSDPNNYA